jgi:hypothetical protein
MKKFRLPTIGRYQRSTSAEPTPGSWRETGGGDRVSRVFQISFTGAITEGEKVEVVGIFRDVLRTRIEAQEACVRGRRVGDHFRLSMHPARFNLMNEHVAAPTVLDGRPDVPDPVLRNLSFWRMARLDHVSCASTACTIAASRHASAGARM